MRLLQAVLVAALLGLWHQATASRAVFAHFMVDNAQSWSQSRWQAQMILAQTASIDAFALNIAAGSATNAEQLPYAFAAAVSTNFKLFFSFDYAGNGAWNQSDVLSTLGSYIHSPAYFQHNGVQPLVSTFEGPDKAADWIEIKRSTGCFFIPDWSSKGAGPAMQLAGGVADGLFSWAAWSWGGNRPDTYTDASYLQALNGKPYMIAASPWFYTNMPGYTKNWMWPTPSMTLWAYRWSQILAMEPAQQPQYVQIISWNDFGESHYIGTEYPSPPFETAGVAKFDYVTGMPHDPLRWPLQVWADQFKHNVSKVTDESIALIYLLHDLGACNDGDTVVNTATQLQYEYLPIDVLNHRFIGYMATLTAPANLTVTVGGHALDASFQYTSPGADMAGGAGVYYGYALIDDGVSGDVSATVYRDGVKVVQASGKPIGGCTEDGYINFNPYVAGDIVQATSPTDTVSLAELVCIEGTGAAGGFHELCSHTCRYGYCPVSACVCTALGRPKTKPKWTGTMGYALSDTNYAGLCSFIYPYGFTFPDHCDTKQHTLTTPSVSPFLPEACTAGVAIGDWDRYGLDDLCSWACGYGYCPIRICSCTDTGPLVPLENVHVPDDLTSVLMPKKDNIALDLMCDFACNYGLCLCYDVTEDEEAPCDFTLSFDSLEQLASAAPSYPDFCNLYYALNVLSDSAATVLSNYTLVNDDYDGLFKYYKQYVFQMIPVSMDDFLLRADGLSYFQCTWTDKSGASSVKECPNFDNPAPYVHLEGDIKVEMKFVNETGFWEVLGTKYGVEKGWVTMQPAQHGVNCHNVRGFESCSATLHIDKYPFPPITMPNITNPKEVFLQAGPQLQNLPVTIYAVMLDVLLGQWNGTVVDPVQVLALPIAMALQAVDAMAQVKRIGETEKEEQKREMIGFIVMAVVSLVPFVGEEIGLAVDMAQIGRLSALAGASGDLGYSLYSVVEDPNSAPMTILGLLLGVGGVAMAGRDAAAYGKMAGVRRGMPEVEISSMGKIVKDQSTVLQKITKSCKL